MWGTISGTTERSLSGLKSIGTTLSVRASVLVVGLLVVSTVGGVGSVAAQECGQSGGDAVHLDTAVLSVGDDGSNQLDVAVAVASDDCTKNDNDAVDADVASGDTTEKNDNDGVDADVASNDSTGMNDNDDVDVDVLSRESTGMNDNDRLEVAVLANQDSGKHDKDGQELELGEDSLPGMYTIYGFRIPL